MGAIDENGWRVFQNGYLAFGECLQSRVLYDGAISRLSEIFFDEIAGVTTISLANEDLSTDQLNGALLFLARPGYNGDRHMEAVVVDTTASSIVIADASGALAEALGSDGRPIADFVVFAFNDSKQANAPTYQTQGTWTSAPSYASSQTTFTDADADDNGGGFASWMVGALLVPDVNIGAPLLIIGATATTLTVAGDARGVAGNGSRYIVYAAPFTDPVRGTWQTDPHKGGTRYLWAGYRYQPPQMGFWVDPPGAAGLGVYGAATGTNRLGQYYCWNRTYDINLGRWTTPDPVATPWWNLMDYVGTGATTRGDARGLAAVAAGGAAAGAAVTGVLTAFGVSLAICLVWPTCRDALIDALKRVGKALEDILKPAPATSSSGGCSSGGATTVGGGSLPTSPHLSGILAAIGAAAAAALVTRIGAAAAIKACEALHDSYKNYKCESCDWRMSAAECLANLHCWTHQFTLRNLWIVMGCDYITPRSIKKGSAGQEDGHIARAINVHDEVVECAGYVAAWGSVAK